MLRGYGWTPIFVEGHEPALMHEAMATALDTALGADQKQSSTMLASSGNLTRPRWPMIVLNSPKGWTGPKMVDGLQVVLDMVGASITESEACRTGTSFLVKSHKITTIHLIAHANCGYYETRFGGMNRNALQEKQVDDMQHAAAWLRRLNSKILVLAYFASVKNGSVLFQDIEINTKKNSLY